MTAPRELLSRKGVIAGWPASGRAMVASCNLPSGNLIAQASVHDGDEVVRIELKVLG
jgi:hypothetical protein